MEALEQKKPAHLELLDIKPGSSELFNFSERRKYRFAISDTLLNDYPDTKFTTKKVEVPQEDGTIATKLKVTRIR